MQKTIERYQSEHQTNNPPREQNMQNFKHGTTSTTKKIEQLETSKKKLVGGGLDSCTFEELVQLEKQLDRSVTAIRAKKMQVYKEQVGKLKEKGKSLAAENAILCREIEVQAKRGASKIERPIAVPNSTDISDVSDVDTQLSIGLPEARIRQRRLQK